jgi:hypothetical protein
MDGTISGAVLSGSAETGVPDPEKMRRLLVPLLEEPKLIRLPVGMP